MASQTKRSSQLVSSAPPPAKPPCKIDAKAIVSEKALLSGTHLITIGPNTVIHPYAKLDAAHAPIELGAHCIVAERAIVGFPAGVPHDGAVKIDEYVSIETGATVEASSVGKGTVVGPFASLRTGCEIGSFCKVAPACTVPAGSVVPDFTVILPQQQSRTDATTSGNTDVQELKLKGQAMQVDVLRRLIPSNIAKWT